MRNIHNNYKKILPVFIVLLLAAFFTGCSKDTTSAPAEKKADQYVEQVKNGSLQIVPDVKVGKAFADFFVNGNWKSFVADDKSRVVEFNGDLTWKKKPAKCTIQFILKDDKSFEVGALAINDVELPMPETMAILEKILKGDKAAIEKADDPIAKMQKQFAGIHEVKGTVLATSYGHSDKGSVSLVQSDHGSYRFILVDETNHQIAGVEYSLEAYNFSDPNGKNKNSKSTVIFNLDIYNDSKGADKDSGVWYAARTHRIPVYALYTFNADGSVAPGMLYTGRGEKPSHYHDYLNEQKNVDLVNLFLTEMQALRKNMQENNISL